ncbi:3-hydroxy-9,10-secoandrosta-1,3,5(10)-triene-9,17-dione monooxygenase oxygenase subunit [Dietzia sp. ANT_WB102]|uniref:3-hydroxy-9,10-secoandrosta-1,3,5(10)-triene-9, 17-dione monooxygenase oxygenase subunit n=1 Tax=Dietzia sp. ANT_WB102 TaxID=2597345 RepID=UPI0011EBD1BD|nr:3-hydroxy-9,10-secoandrosta-1,3,5(10)-triene-9,17-dione monooxygenase oxygenase subunit [Dietzia sp. ANT_WB102]KAA0917861.1 flavin-dependent monooxygenase [Dietzia sp. ANT_WB102]
MSEYASHEVIDRIKVLLPGFAERAQETEDLRKVHPKNIAELDEAGFFKLCQPARWGGYEADMETFYTAVRHIASACPSTGWCASILGIHNWHLALFSEQAQNDVWGEDSTVRISSSYAPMGAAKKTDQGLVLNGKWSWSSGCQHADWVFVGGPVMDENDKMVDFCTFLVEKSQYEILDVWHVAGLKGTGSNDILIKDAIIPEHRVLSFGLMAATKSPGLEINTNPIYKMPWGTIHPTTISAPIVGMAFGCYDVHREHQRERVRAAFGTKVKDDVFAKVRLAEAAGDIDASWLQLMRNVREEMDLIKAGDYPGMDIRTRARRDQVRATQRSIDAIGLLFQNSGARALEDTSPIQRFWRDANAGRVHAANEATKAYIMFGQNEFGEKVTDSMV